MTINLSVPIASSSTELKPRISVIGVGGAGGNAVNNMIQMGLEGVEFIVANSDAQALAHSSSERKIQMGTEVTKGLGAGSNPNIGRAAAEESLEEILAHLKDVNMVFVTAGLGGGTGTGAAPVIAKAARDQGILTVGVVTKPFQFEGANRMTTAETGLEELQSYVDTLLIIPNQNLFRVANENTTFADAFKMADDVLYSGVRGVTDLMVMPGLINLDFADIRSVMSEMGKAMMGTGEAEGDRRAVEAAEAAIANPLLDDTSMIGAKGVLINITAGKDITLFEVDEAANRIRDEVADDANIIFGSTFDESLEGKIRVSVVATGIATANNQQGNRPTTSSVEAYDQPIKSNPPGEILTATLPPAAKVNLHGMDFQSEQGAQSTNVNNDLEPEVSSGQEDLIQHIENSVGRNRELSEVPGSAKNSSTNTTFIPEPAFSSASSDDVRANPFAAADLLNAKGEETPVESKKRDGLSLIERVTRATLGDRKREKERVDPEPSAITKPILASPELSMKRSSGTHKGNILDERESVIESPKEDDQSLAKKVDQEKQEIVVTNQSEESAFDDQTNADNDIPSLLEDASQDQGLTGLVEEEDLLDIPAFLRRQAN